MLICLKANDDLSVNIVFNHHFYGASFKCPLNDIAGICIAWHKAFRRAWNVRTIALLADSIPFDINLIDRFCKFATTKMLVPPEHNHQFSHEHFYIQFEVCGGK